MEKSDPQPNPNPTPGTLPWLVAIMRTLLGPEGCPWDKEQTLESLKPFLLEEAYEVLEAIDDNDPQHHAEELGDVLFQIVFQAELAHLPLEQVIQCIGDKLIRRHPHVFGQAQVASSRDVIINWERIKQTEHDAPRGALDGVPRTMPALARAFRLTRKAARVGFDWPEIGAVRDKVQEELGETDGAVQQGDPAHMAHEIGDLLFAIVNWARHLNQDPEEALRQANARFEQRFRFVEHALTTRGRSPADSSLAEMDALWEEAKRAEDGEGASQEAKAKGRK